MAERKTDSHLMRDIEKGFEFLKDRYGIGIWEQELNQYLEVTLVSSDLRRTLRQMFERERMRGRIEGMRYAMGVDMYTGLACPGSQEIGEVDLKRGLEPPFSLSIIAQREQLWMRGKLSFLPVEGEGSR